MSGTWKKAGAGPIFKVVTKNEVCVVLQYWNITPDDPTPEYEAVMRICRPAQIATNAGSVLSLNSMHLFADGETGWEAKRGAFISAEICRQLQLEVTPVNMRRITNRILDSVDDVFKMPPYVPQVKQIGEATVTVGDKKFTREILQ